MERESDIFAHGWREQRRRIDLGFRAELCPACGTATCCSFLRRENRLLALYFFPLSTWMTLESLAHCSACGTQWQSDGRTKSFSPTPLDIIDLLEATNPELAERQLRREHWMADAASGRLRHSARQAWIDELWNDASILATKPTVLGRVINGLLIFAFIIFAPMLLIAGPMCLLDLWTKKNPNAPAGLAVAMFVASLVLATGATAYGVILINRAIGSKRHEAASQALCIALRPLSPTLEELREAASRARSRGNKLGRHFRWRTWHDTTPS